MVQTTDEAQLETSHWDRERFNDELRHAKTNIHPEHWPPHVRMISQNGLGYLGLDDKGQLYLDGEEVYTVKRWSWVERILAGSGVGAAWVAAIATAISACADWRSAPVEQPSHSSQASSSQASSSDPMTYYAKLGSTKDEVGYRMGYPQSVQGPWRDDPKGGGQISDDLPVNSNGDLEGTPSNPPGGTALAAHDDWHYKIAPNQVDVQFDPATKRLSSVSCSQQDEKQQSKCRPLFGVTIGSTEEALIAALGTPEKQDLTGIFKMAEYPSKGAVFMLTKGRVYRLTKYVPVKPS